MKTEKHLYQWDINQHFSNVQGIYVDYTINDEVFRVEVVNRTCVIPDELLQIAGKHVAYECLADGTRTEVTFMVSPRPLPPDYVFTPTQRITFDSLVEKVESLIEKGVDPEVIKESVQKYLEEHPIESYDDTELRGRIEALESIDYDAMIEGGVQAYWNAHKSELKGDTGSKGDPFRYEDFTPEQLASLKGEKGADGQKGQDGINGVDGKDGSDGLTPYIKNNNWWIGNTDTGIKAVGSDGRNGTDGTNGQDGKDGKTPIKGTDYFTEADKQELVNDVLDALPEAEGGEF